MVFAMNCNKEIAFEKAMVEIKKKYPNYEKNKPYKIRESGNNWDIFGTLPEGFLGGTPQVSIEKNTCNIISVNHGR